MGDAIVGVVANPRSGRDIRRLVTQASVFPTAEILIDGAGHMPHMERPAEVQAAIEETIARST